MINRIKKLLDEVYNSSATYYPSGLKNLEITTDIFKNSDSTEIQKLIKSSEYGSLRFFMNHKEDYLLWDSDKFTHHAIFKYSYNVDDFNKDSDLRGIVFGLPDSQHWNTPKPKSVYIYKTSAHQFYKDEIYDKFGKKTKPSFWKMYLDDLSKAVNSFSELIYYNDIDEYIVDLYKKSKMYTMLNSAGISEVVLGNWL